MGNPHLACLTDVDVDALDLTAPPGVDPALFPDGVNVELVNRRVAPGRRHIRLRVHERGVGETRSCGTGACAAAYAALAPRGRTDGHRRVDVPGGRLSVQVDATGRRCSPARPCSSSAGRALRGVARRLTPTLRRRSSSVGRRLRHRRLALGSGDVPAGSPWPLS